MTDGLLHAMSAEVRVGAATLPLLALLESWALRVLRVYTELETTVAECEWGMDDYVGALFARDWLERGLQAAGLTQGRREPSAVLAVDALFRSFTLPDEHGFLQNVQRGLPVEPWWWTRIPSRGPIADEITALGQRLRTGGAEPPVEGM